jgi:hypothetical protein
MRAAPGRIPAGRTLPGLRREKNGHRCRRYSSAAGRKTAAAEILEKIILDPGMSSPFLVPGKNGPPEWDGERAFSDAISLNEAAMRRFGSSGRR